MRTIESRGEFPLGPSQLQDEGELTTTIIDLMMAGTFSSTATIAASVEVATCGHGWGGGMERRVWQCGRGRK